MDMALQRSLCEDRNVTPLCVLTLVNQAFAFCLLFARCLRIRITYTRFTPVTLIRCRQAWKPTMRSGTSDLPAGQSERSLMFQVSALRQRRTVSQNRSAGYRTFSIKLVRRQA